MNRTVELLTAIAATLRGAQGSGGPFFQDVRVELDRYSLEDLLKQSMKTPAARVCFMRGKPVVAATGDRDLQVSVAIVVLAGRSGRPSPEFSSADIAVLELMATVTALIDADPYLGLGRVSAADMGDQLVAVSDETGGRGIAIGLVEISWVLLGAQPARPVLAASTGMMTQALDLTVTSGGETIAPEAAP